MAKKLAEDLIETNEEVIDEAIDEAARERRLRRLSWLLDDSIRLPGGFRIGLDAIIGLIPGIGDLGGAALSGYLVFESARLGVRGFTLVRMVINVLVETIIGAVPLVGDIFDMTFKANMRNLRLLERHLQVSVTEPRRSRFLPGLAALAMLASAIAAVIALLVLAWRAAGG